MRLMWKHQRKKNWSRSETHSEQQNGKEIGVKVLIYGLKTLSIKSVVEVSEMKETSLSI
mgnify:CR=1 FL=1